MADPSRSGFVTIPLLPIILTLSRVDEGFYDEADAQHTVWMTWMLLSVNEEIWDSEAIRSTTGSIWLSKIK